MRDKIPEICAAENQTPDFHVLSTDAEFLACLLDKLAEETSEMARQPCVEEAADVLEVLLAIGALKGFTKEDLLLAAREKREKKGGFSKRFFLRSVSELK